MSIDFEICCASCGCCCSQKVLCEKCEISTLRANGLPAEWAYKIHGLKKEWPGNRGFQYSELYNKLKELIKIQIENA